MLSGLTLRRVCLLCLPACLPTLQPFEYLGTAVSTGVMFMALAWVLFDFGEDPPSSSGGSGLSGGPRK
jgi:hypothetical protein